MQQSKSTFYILMVLSACLGLVLGAYSARKIVSSQKETLQIERSTQVREWPSELAAITSLNKNDRLEVISQADYTEKNAPTILKVIKPLKLVDKATQQQYLIKENSYYPVVAVKKDSYIIKADTNKGNTVELELSAKAVIPLEAGLWKHVKDKSGYMGWVRVK